MTDTRTEIREARDYTGKLTPMPTPAKGYTRRATYDEGIVELWARYTSSGTMFALVYGLQMETGLDRPTAARKLGEALLHAAECEGKLD
jgi:hypothetical protein